jgi:hypothetical protein
MIKKVFITVFLINVIFITILLEFNNYSILEKSKNLEKKIVDIQNSNVLINTNSNLIKENITANEQQ